MEALLVGRPHTVTEVVASTILVGHIVVATDRRRPFIGGIAAIKRALVDLQLTPDMTIVPAVTVVVFPTGFEFISTLPI
jgi:hypothetical protein